MQDLMGRNAAFLLFWGILNAHFPPDSCQTDSTFTASPSPNLSMITPGISSSESAKTSMDTSMTSETPTLTPSHANNVSITTTVSSTQDDQMSHSDSWTTGTLTGTQKPEPETETSTNREQMASSESTVTATPDSSPSIYTTTPEPKHLTMRSTAESYSTIQPTTQPVNTLTSATSQRISSTGSATATSTDTSLTLSQANNELISTTVTQDDAEQTSDSNTYISLLTDKELTGSQKPEPTTDRSVRRETEFFESTTMIAHPTTTTGSSSPSPPHSAATTTQQLESSDHTQSYIMHAEQTPQSATDPPDGTTDAKKVLSSIRIPVESTTSAISDYLTTDDNYNDSQETSTPVMESQSSQFETTDATLNPSLVSSPDSTALVETSSSVIVPQVTATHKIPNSEHSQTPGTGFTASTSSTTATPGTVSKQAVTSDSKSTSINMPSMFPTTQENQKANSCLNPFSPVSSLTAISTDSKPVTTPLAEERKGSTVRISVQTVLNRSDSERTTITDTWSNSISSAPAGLTSPPLLSSTSRDGNADDSANSVKSSTVFVFNIPKVPVFKTITFNHALVNQVTVMQDP